MLLAISPVSTSTPAANTHLMITRSKVAKEALVTMVNDATKPLTV